MRKTLAALLLTAALLSAADDDIDARIKSLMQAYSLLEENAADPITTDQVFYGGAIPGLLKRLDPHSIFFDSGQFDQVKKMEDSTQKGFGSIVSLLPGRVFVLQTTPGTPSQKAGLAPGDEILAVNGYVIAQLELEQIAELLGASRQRQAQLEVRRPGNAVYMHFVLTPEELQQPSVDRAFMLNPDTGYIRVGSFDEKTGEQIKTAVESLGGDKLKGLVMDLRNNPGGVVTAALETAALFLKPGQKILSIKGRSKAEETETVPLGATPYKFKLAILVNGKSASASEIVTGAMQDHDRAVVLGEPSFGKGLVQNVFPLLEGNGLALTVALYYTPSGRSIQKPLDAEKFELGAVTAHPNAQSEFHTDSGRKVTGGGGIQPDFTVYPENTNRLRNVLDATGAFTSFATEYLAGHKVDQNFEVTPQMLDQFQTFLAPRKILPGISDWGDNHDFIVNRLKAEIFDQAFGVAKGDQVEAQRDPVILKALEQLKQ